MTVRFKIFCSFTLLCCLFAAALIRPSEAAEGQTGAIEEARFLPLDGIQQWITIRAADRNKPIIDGAGHFALMTHTQEFVAAIREDVRLLSR